MKNYIIEHWISLSVFTVLTAIFIAIFHSTIQAFVMWIVLIPAQQLIMNIVNNSLFVNAAAGGLIICFKSFIWNALKTWWNQLKNKK